MNLSNLHPAEGSKHSDSFRRGRGHGSGNGKTAGKGHKGQKARSGAPRIGFEGGQMPLYRRIPKRGFKNINSKEIVGINVSVLERFDNDSTVSVETLMESGIIAGGPVRAVVELAGIRNIRTKSLGSNNKTNVVLATMEGLLSLKTPEQVAKNRGKSVEEVVC